ncbi:3-deoxy-D-manno-octulosonic acid transferase [Christiangramia fulva]|uniref:3-deoxy-D-manno-octulosonic acid transferase n=1 Tax=Christiangramia fulva TaxID=2126553 RepID=A0A2R3ZAU6_9FLAO|nr:3-deoxy-D-manno-octulosonic acid transferase [Christiangramia fulva]
MHSIYNFLIYSAQNLLKTAGIFSPKLAEFTKGRKQLFQDLKEKVQAEEKYIWIHAASLGEFEMAVPVMKMLRKNYPQKKILISFFSPSGFKNKKKHPLVDIFTYLPLDTPANARKFLDIVQPEMAIFIKYDFWPNFLKELKQRKIRSFLVSGVFRKDQLFFKSYGKWMRNSLEAFEHFFVQDKESQRLLAELGFTNSTVAGDTRFDRVAAQLESDNHIDFLEDFCGSETIIVFGSTWPEDEELFVEAINKTKKGKFIIAPHEIKAEKIEDLVKKLTLPSVLFSEKEAKDLSEYRVFILDTIGYLGRAYSYANIAYVGGAAGKTGLHNILEPATFGVPIITGKNISKFPEARKLQKLAGLFSVENKDELTEILQKLLKNENFREKTGMISEHFVNSNTGATRLLESYLSKA